MRRITRSLAFFFAGGTLLGTCAVPSAADESKVADQAAPAKSEQEIARLIAQLGCERFRDREQATNELSKLGKPALPGLKEATKSPDAEVRRRAQRLVDQIQLPSVRSIGPQIEHQIPDPKTYL
jgi:hypothetical protein